MILVDTSLWIEILNGRVPAAARRLPEFVTCGPVVQEVLQGLRDTAASREFSSRFEALPCIGDPIPRATFAAAAGIYRVGRQKGYTVRSSIDCLIAAIAIDYGIPVWHRDRDFAVISRYTPLRALSQHSIS